MKCYTHTLNEAVGICKKCGKGVCPECAVDVGKGLACRDSCEVDVHAINIMEQRNKAAIQHQSRSYNISAVFMSALGIAFMLLGWFVGGSFQYLYMFMGLLFIGVSVYNLWVSRRVFSEKEGM